MQRVDGVDHELEQAVPELSARVQDGCPNVMVGGVLVSGHVGPAGRTSAQRAAPDARLTRRGCIRVLKQTTNTR